MDSVSILMEVGANWDLLQLAQGWIQMSRDPDAKYGDIDASDQGSNPPFYSNGCLFVLDNNGNPVYDDLHKELDLYERV